MATPPKCPSRLADRWVFWLDKWESSNGQTVQSLADIGEADTARGFWNIFDANPVEKLPESCSLHVFKGAVRPEWEDKANIHGGHFRFTPLPDQPHASPGRLWYNLVLGAIGAQFTLSSSVVGVGFTNKGARKVVSVWINTADQAVVRALQADMHAHTGDRFVSKFVAHQSIPRSDFTAQETVLHRRTKSAPSQYISIDAFEDDEAADLSGSGGDKAATAGGSGGVSATLKRKAAPAPLDSTLASYGGADPHLRSKSEGVSRDIVPNVRPLPTSASNAPSATHSTAVRGAAVPLLRTSPPPAGGAATTPGAGSGQPGRLGPGDRAESEAWNWQDSHSTELRESNSGVYPPDVMKAPTPMKEWADQWSPSLMNVNRPALDTQSNVTSPGQGNADSQSAAQQHMLQMATAGGGHTESPMSLSRTQPQAVMMMMSDPYAPQQPQHQQQQQQPFGSFPLQMHQRMEQQQQQQQQHQQHYQHQAPPQHDHHQQMYHPQHIAVHNPYQTHHAAQAYTQYTAPPPPMPGANGYPSQLPYVIVRQPVSHYSPQPAQDQRAAPPRTQQRASDRAFPLRQGAEGAPDRSSRSPPPNRNGAGAAPAFGGSALRRDSPPAKGNSPPPSVAGGDRRAQHTKSDAPPFLFKGWMYPSGLNRKERRRIMFGEDVTPGDCPGAIFKGEGFPDGACDEDGNPVAEGSASGQ